MRSMVYILSGDTLIKKLSVIYKALIRMRSCIYKYFAVLINRITSIRSFAIAVK